MPRPNSGCSYFKVMRKVVSCNCNSKSSAKNICLSVYVKNRVMQFIKKGEVLVKQSIMYCSVCACVCVFCVFPLFCAP